MSVLRAMQVCDFGGRDRIEVAKASGNALAAAWLNGRQDTIDLWGFDEFYEEFAKEFFAVIYAAGRWEEFLKVQWEYGCETATFGPGGSGISARDMFEKWKTEFLADLEEGARSDERAEAEQDIADRSTPDAG